MASARAGLAPTMLGAQRRVSAMTVLHAILIFGAVVRRVRFASLHFSTASCAAGKAAPRRVGSEVGALTEPPGLRGGSRHRFPVAFIERRFPTSPGDRLVAPLACHDVRIHSRRSSEFQPGAHVSKIVHLSRSLTSTGHV